jgi:hypothetical protein
MIKGHVNPPPFVTINFIKDDSIIRCKFFKNNKQSLILNYMLLVNSQLKFIFLFHLKFYKCLEPDRSYFS